MFLVHTSLSSLLKWLLALAITLVLVHDCGGLG